MSDLTHIDPGKPSAISQALALGNQIQHALDVAEQAEEAAECQGDQRQELEFLGAMNATEIERATRELRDAATEPSDARKTNFLLAMMFDALPAAANFDSGTLRQTLLALIDTEEPQEIFRRGGYWGRERLPDAHIQLAGFGPRIVSRAIRRLLSEATYAPSPAQILTALQCERSRVARACVKAEALLEKRRRVLESATA